MPFLPFVVLLAWQALSKSASFALGWAMAIYFGQVPGKQGRVLAVVSLAAAAWLILVIGFAVPLLAGAALASAGVIERNFTVQPLHAWGLGAVVVLAPPLIAAVTVWGKFHDDRSAGQWLRMVPSCYPATASLGLGVIQMVLFTPIIVARRLVNGHSLLQTAVSMRERAGDGDLAEAVRKALNSVGREDVHTDAAPPLLAWPMRTVGFATRHLIGAVVRGSPTRLRSEGLQLFAYATNVAVLGPSEPAHRARAALLRELPFYDARLTWSEDAQDLEDAIMDAAPQASDPADLHSRLEAIQREMDATDLNAEEWNLLYRLRLQVEAQAEERGGRRGVARAAGTEVVSAAATW